MKTNEIVSDTKLKKGSRELALQSYVSLIPIAGGLSVSGIFFVLEMFTPLYLALGVAGFGVAAMVGNLSFRQEHFKNEFMKVFNVKIQIENKKKIENIKKTLKNQKAVKQIELFEQKHDRFEEVLNNQLNNTSLAYQRLIGSFDQLNLIALNNIEKVLNYESNMVNIDLNYITKELKTLKEKEVLTDYEESEIKSLETRIGLRAEYEEKINRILSDNESALTKMDITLANLTELRKPENMKHVLQELQDLSEVLNKKAGSYN